QLPLFSSPGESRGTGVGRLGIGARRGRNRDSRERRHRTPPHRAGRLLRSIGGAPEDVTMAPIRQSPLFRRHEQAGASFVDHQGWRVPAYFTFAQKEAEQLAKSVAVSDVSWMVKLDVKGHEPKALDGTAW